MADEDKRRSAVVAGCCAIAKRQRVGQLDAPSQVGGDCPPEVSGFGVRFAYEERQGRSRDV